MAWREIVDILSKRKSEVKLEFGDGPDHCRDQGRVQELNYVLTLINNLLNEGEE